MFFGYRNCAGTIWRRRWRRGAVLLLVAGVVLAPGSSAQAAPTTGAGREVNGIPVRGVLAASIRGSSEFPHGTVVLHGVRRIAGGTVVYYSVSSAPGGAVGRDLSDFSTANLLFDYTSYAGKVALMDGTNAYLPLKGEDRFGSRRLAMSTRYTRPLAPNVFYTAYVVFPELPAATARVDVMIGNVGVFPAAPVEEGVLTPAVDGKYLVPLGSGWPAIDLARVAAADATGSVIPLEKRVEDLERDVRTTERGADGTVDLSADVLFAVDSATLTPGAAARIRAAAATINAKAEGGRIVVTGHTDANGSPSYNVELSRRRAQTVAAALKPLVTVPGVTYVVEGKGETAPVASNETAQGRQENRRVSIAFTIKGA